MFLNVGTLLPKEETDFTGEAALLVAIFIKKNNKKIKKKKKGNPNESAYIVSRDATRTVLRAAWCFRQIQSLQTLRLEYCDRETRETKVVYSDMSRVVFLFLTFSRLSRFPAHSADSQMQSSCCAHVLISFRIEWKSSMVKCRVFVGRYGRLFQCLNVAFLLEDTVGCFSV